MKFGCIGIGNMGAAILRGAFSAGSLDPQDTCIYDTNMQKCLSFKQEYAVECSDNLESLINASDIILIAVKPHILNSVLKEHSACFKNKAVISIAAGRNMKTLSAMLPESCRILRVMPNTPALVGEGMIVFETCDTLSSEEKSFAYNLFSSVGSIDSVDAKLMDAVTGVSGSGPAYVYMFIEALADGGVRAGLPREIAKKLAAQTVIGAAKMVLETGENPEELKDRVCSPGGTTIEAVAALEEHGLRNAVLKAVQACVEKSISIGK